MLDTAKRKTILQQMILVRAFEEKLEELYQRKAMYGSTHSYRGQEAIAVGVCAALERTDLDVEPLNHLQEHAEARKQTGADVPPRAGKTLAPHEGNRSPRAFASPLA